MPGKYIRTASGIVPVKDWYIRVLGDSSSTTSHTLTAATAAGGSKGYENGNAAIGQPAYGTFSPLSAGGLEVRGITWAQGAANEPTIVYIGPAGGAGTPVPADNDTTFSRIDITGVFFNSGGSSVTRTLVRADRDFFGSGSNGTAQFQFRNAKAAQLISGNAYTVVVQRSGSVGSLIKQVKAAYIRTASGIKQYWPANSISGMVAANIDSNAVLGYNTGGHFSFSAGGTFSPTAIDATNEITALMYQPSTNKVLLAIGTSFGAPADSDATFKTMTATGVFSDSAGGTVTRTVLRTQMSNSGVTAFNRGWELVGGAVAIPKFIAGNTYTVTFAH